MQLNCDENSANYPVNGTSALEAEETPESLPYKGKKKSRRKNKKNAVTYALETEIAEPEIKAVIKTDENISEKSAEQESAELQQPLPLQAEPTAVPEIKTEPLPAPEAKPTEPQPEITRPPVSSANEVFGGSIRTDVQPEKETPLSDSSGIVYEIAEELYRKEKTQAELEALCHPPFTKVFTQKQKDTLDREAEERTRRLVSAAALAQAKEPVFLPDGLYEEADKPISTAAAFLIQLIMLIPVVNIAVAIILSFTGNTNRNIRAYTRGFLMWSVLFTLALLAYLAVYYINAESIAVWQNLR